MSDNTFTRAELDEAVAYAIRQSYIKNAEEIAASFEIAAGQYAGHSKTVFYGSDIELMLRRVAADMRAEAKKVSND